MQNGTNRVKGRYTKDGRIGEFIDGVYDAKRKGEN